MSRFSQLRLSHDRDRSDDYIDYLRSLRTSNEYIRVTESLFPQIISPETKFSADVFRQIVTKTIYEDLRIAHLACSGFDIYIARENIKRTMYFAILYMRQTVPDCPIKNAVIRKFNTVIKIACEDHVPRTDQYTYWITREGYHKCIDIIRSVFQHIGTTNDVKTLLEMNGAALEVA